MAVWCPFARRNPLFDGGSFVGAVTIGVLHTTESTSFTPRVDSYFGHRNNPHFTVDLPDLEVWQHTPLDRASRALANRAGGVETNREGAVQIEVVAFARDPAWSRGDTSRTQLVRDLMRWIEANTRIPRRCGVTFGGNEQYGLGNGYELTGRQWEAYEGWLGHQHVPENSHWDPGKIDIGNLIGQEATMFVERGDTGEWVEYHQRRLADLGFYTGELDGAYGPKMAAAVLAMRKSQGSSATSGDRVTPAAAKQLDAAFVAAKAPPPSPPDPGDGGGGPPAEFTARITPIDTQAG